MKKLLLLLVISSVVKLSNGMDAKTQILKLKSELQSKINNLKKPLYSLSKSEQNKIMNIVGLKLVTLIMSGQIEGIFKSNAHFVPLVFAADLDAKYAYMLQSVGETFLRVELRNLLVPTTSKASSSKEIAMPTPFKGNVIVFDQRK